MNLRIWSLFAGLAFTLLSAGCGGASTQTAAVNMREFAFSPDGFTVTAGTEVTLNLSNLGALEHNFHIMRPGSEVTDSWSESDLPNALLTVEKLGGGENRTVTFTAPAVPGEYQFVCSIPAHFEQGMVGVMTVTEP